MALLPPVPALAERALVSALRLTALSWARAPAVLVPLAAVGAAAPREWLRSRRPETRQSTTVQTGSARRRSSHALRFFAVVFNGLACRMLIGAAWVGNLSKQTAAHAE